MLSILLAIIIIAAVFMVFGSLNNVMLEAYGEERYWKSWWPWIAAIGWIVIIISYINS